MVVSFFLNDKAELDCRISKGTVFQIVGHMPRKLYHQSITFWFYNLAASAGLENSSVET